MGPGDLAQVLGDLALETDERVVVGFDGADDAAVVRLDDGKLIVQTLDFFTPIVDDPYNFGQIAAANALSDIYAMGGTPLYALNIVGFPINDLPKEILQAILQGGADKAKEAGIPIVGGHSVDDKEPKYGMVVTGEVQENHLVRNSSAKPGDALILTKPLGTGIIATAIKKGKASEESITAATKSMATLNKAAADAMKNVDIHAATDVTGYGLLGHLLEMCKASGVSAEVNFSSLEFLPGVRELAEAGIIPGGTKRNLEYVKDSAKFDSSLSETDQLMVADAQTSGGLLVALPENETDRYISLVDSDYFFTPLKIGNISDKSEYLISVS
ncbi:MAG: selenide, water dikinase SelD [Candidatus Marinimicrobia bacterium]|nr:selenide, water dikinase SelD [Candidatus Neomarinimicrobiota bacterium]